MSFRGKLLTWYFEYIFYKRNHFYYFCYSQNVWTIARHAIPIHLDRDLILLAPNNCPRGITWMAAETCMFRFNLGKRLIIPRLLQNLQFLLLFLSSVSTPSLLNVMMAWADLRWLSFKPLFAKACKWAPCLIHLWYVLEVDPGWWHFVAKHSVSAPGSALL